MSNFDRVRDSVAAAGGDVAGFEAGERKRMTTKPQQLLFLPFTRRLSLTERIGHADEQPVTGVTLRDLLGGAEYDVVLDERGRPTYYAVRAIDGALTGITEWPRDYVVLRVRRYLEREAAGDIEADIQPRNDAEHAGSTSGQPRHEYIGQLIREAYAAGVSPRQVVAARTRNHTSSVDRWIREARKHDETLPRATRSGLKGKATTEGSDR